MSKKNKFNRQWESQTNLGKKFGLSSIAVGKILIEHGLKDNKTKHATDKALKEDYAKSTPLKDETPHFMWNARKVKKLFSKDHQQLSKVDYWASHVSKIMKEAEDMCSKGDDKIGYMLADSAYEDVPQNIIEEVKSKIESLNCG